MQDFDRLGDLDGQRLGIRSEIGVREHPDHRFDTEVAYGLRGHQRRVDQILDRRTRIDCRVGEEHRSALGRHDFHRSQRRVAVRRENLSDRLQRIGIAMRITENRRIGIAGVDHHQREPVALHHVLDRLAHADSLAADLVVEKRRIAVTARLLLVALEIDDAPGIERQMILAEQRVDLGPAAHKQRHGDVLVGQMYGGLDRRQTLSLAEGDAARRGRHHFRADAARPTSGHADAFQEWRYRVRKCN